MYQRIRENPVRLHPGEFLSSFLTAICFLLSGRNQGLAVRAPGPDAFGYTVAATSQFTFLQITNRSGATNVGTRVLSFDDDTPYTANIGFTFNFYGSNYSTVSFNPNGLMTFGGQSSNYFNVDLTTTPPSNDLPAIAVLWDDWETMEPTGWTDAVYYKTIGTAGSRQFIVQWNQVRPVNGDGTNTVTFEARLFEDLMIWTSIGTASESSPGEFEFEDTGTAGLEARFYRVRAP